MSRRLTIIVITVALLLVGGLGWYWWVNRAAVAPVQPPSSTAPTTPSSEAPLEVVVTPQQIAQADLTVAAMTFAERYGSYSTDAPLANLANSATFATTAYQAELKNEVAGTAAQGGAFYGVSTRALTAEIKAQTSSAATVAVLTQRQERFGRQGDIRLSYQTLEVKLEKAEAGWLVAGATWLKQ